MIINDSSYKNVGGFTDDDTREMRAFLLGAVHVWCRDRHGEWFAARDLLGGANFFWQGTPLIALYDHYLQKAMVTVTMLCNKQAEPLAIY